MSTGSAVQINAMALTETGFHHLKPRVASQEPRGATFFSMNLVGKCSIKHFCNCSDLSLLPWIKTGRGAASLPTGLGWATAPRLLCRLLGDLKPPSNAVQLHLMSTNGDNRPSSEHQYSMVKPSSKATSCTFGVSHCCIPISNSKEEKEQGWEQHCSTPPRDTLFVRLADWEPGLLESKPFFQVSYHVVDPEYSLPVKSFQSVNSSHNQVNWFIHTAESHSFTVCDLNLLIWHQKTPVYFIILFWSY